MNRVGLSIATSVLVGCCACSSAVVAFSTPVPERTAKNQLCKSTNLMPLFWKFWGQARGRDQKSQRELFKEIVVKTHPELYSPEVLVGLKDLDQAISMFLEWVPPHVETMNALSRRLPGRLGASQKKFRRVFKDFQCRTNVFLMPSLGAFDGATRTVNGKTALLFGVDVIAKIYGLNGFKAFFDHELFHVYHQFGPPTTEGHRPPLYVSLWGEGLATYISHALNPTTPESMILGEPKDLAVRAKPVLPRLARELKENLENTSEAIYRKFFFGRAEAESDFPPRSGYYVGYLIAQSLAKRYTLTELVELDGEKLRAELAAGLDRLVSTTR